MVSEKVLCMARTIQPQIVVLYSYYDLPPTTPGPLSAALRPE